MKRHVWSASSWEGLGGVLDEAVGAAAGAVKPQKKETVEFHEERSFPRSRDPRRSPG